MSCDVWKWISASAYEIRPEDDSFVSWQHLRLQNLTWFHLPNKVCHLISLCIYQNKDLSVMSNPMMCIDSKWPKLGNSSCCRAANISYWAYMVVTLEVQSIDYVKQNFVYTSDNQDNIVIISEEPWNVNKNLWAICFSWLWLGDGAFTWSPTCRVSPWCSLAPEKALELSAPADISLSSTNLVYLVLLFPDFFSSVSPTKPNLKVPFFVFPGLKLQIPLQAEVQFICEEFIFSGFILLFFF